MIKIKNMKRLLLNLLLLLPVAGFSQIHKAGVIIPDVYYDSIHIENYGDAILIPATGFALYNQPAGNKIGKIEKGQELSKDIILTTHEEARIIDANDFTQVVYEKYVINYSDSINGFIKINNSKKSYWISIKEIKSQGYKTVRWIDFLVKNSDDVLGYYANDKGIKLMQVAKDNGKIIATLKGDLYEIKLTGKILDQWAKVKVTKYKVHPCNGDIPDNNIEYKIEGWIQIVDTEGEPAIWWYARGC